MAFLAVQPDDGERLIAAEGIYLLSLVVYIGGRNFNHLPGMSTQPQSYHELHGPSRHGAGG